MLSNFRDTPPWSLSRDFYMASIILCVTSASSKVGTGLEPSAKASHALPILGDQSPAISVSVSRSCSPACAKFKPGGEHLYQAVQALNYQATFGSFDLPIEPLCRPRLASLVHDRCDSFILQGSGKTKIAE